MQLELLNDQVKTLLEVNRTVFGRDYNEALVHQIVAAYQC